MCLNIFYNLFLLYFIFRWTDLRGQHFVVLGAGSQMGPTETLLRMGATVIGVDLPRAEVWERLAAEAKASYGKLIIPVKKVGTLY